MGQPDRDDIQAQLCDEVKRLYRRLIYCPLDDEPPAGQPGVYAFFIDEKHPCYVGRTSNLRRRIQQHRRGNGEAGHLPATIERQSREPGQQRTPITEATKERVRKMKVRWVVVAEDDHGVLQALLELYAAVKLPTLPSTIEGRRYNTFKNH